MQPPSVTPSRGHNSWQGALLTVSLLLSWGPPTTAQLSIESVPPAAAEGQDVLLRNPSRAEAIFYNWYKGDNIDPKDGIATYEVTSKTTTEGPAHTGREKIYPNGSLLLQHVTLADTGAYLLQIIKTTGFPEKLTGQIHVFRKLPKPSIKSNSSNPVEDQDSVTLLCEPETQNTTYQWLINNHTLPDNSRLELSMDNRTLTIHTVTRNELGLYECRTRNPVSSSHSDPFFLNVLYGPDTPTISPSAEHYSPGDTINLTCQAGSNPSAQYSWFINETYRQSIQQLLIPNITVGDSGSYACRVHNPDTARNRTTIKTITVSGDRSVGGRVLSAGGVTSIVIAGLVGVFLVATLAYFLFRAKTRGNPTFLWAADGVILDISSPRHRPLEGKDRNLKSEIFKVAMSALTRHGQSDTIASMHPLYANQAAVPIYEQTETHVTASVVSRQRSQEEDLPE
ncbi:cell adhesion molecule CEACAM6-like [Tenrec ecaudatus]|uniref:cell adhesion molecule CEACAM6-like n=1 Tax=Tenrec ecaudatus TaxID=94439 RepID=UPI003F5A7CF6